MTKIIATVPLVGLSQGKTKIKFEVAGVVGESCTNVTAAFEKALSEVPTEVSLKSEFYQAEERREFLNLD